MFWFACTRFDYFFLGSQVAYLLECILQEASLKADNIHLIVFSLGAHLMENVGMKLTAKSIKIGRITSNVYA